MISPLAIVVALAASAGAAAPPAAREVAAVRVLDGRVERGRGESWTVQTGSFRIAPGERVRTGADGMAVLSLPWMEILLGGDSVVALPRSLVLSTSLERGRIEQRALSDILKVTTPEAEVRGQGTVIVRRSDSDPGAGITAVSPLRGTFQVRLGRRRLAVGGGQGLVVRAGARSPEVLALPAAPTGISPARDPVYAPRGKPVLLGWRGSTRRYHVEVSSLSGDEVVLAREVTGAGLPLQVEWLGTFRWRVSAVDDNGLEGPPSEPGFFCVVEK